MIFLISGCNQSYQGSPLVPDFPVPEEASLDEKQKDFETYRYDIRGSHHGIRADYLVAIQDWGWQERKDLHQEAVYIFEKNGEFVSLNVLNSDNNALFTIKKVTMEDLDKQSSPEDQPGEQPTDDNPINHQLHIHDDYDTWIKKLGTPVEVRSENQSFLLYYTREGMGVHIRQNKQETEKVWIYPQYLTPAQDVLIPFTRQEVMEQFGHPDKIDRETCYETAECEKYVYDQEDQILTIRFSFNDVYVDRMIYEKKDPAADFTSWDEEQLYDFLQDVKAHTQKSYQLTFVQKAEIIAHYEKFFSPELSKKIVDSLFVQTDEGWKVPDGDAGYIFFVPAKESDNSDVVIDFEEDYIRLKVTFETGMYSAIEYVIEYDEKPLITEWQME
ncbi:MAG: hypothetical protein H0Z33_08590 [Bacillaceae bacterium]|nr:hypothetical protein [Bacillaceae bacterium]